MTAKKQPGQPGTYAEGVEQAQQALATGRLNDPDEHFPYKLDTVRRLVEENPSLGPDGDDDDRVQVEDVMSQRIASATDDYVEAQAAFWKNRTERNRTAYRSAADDLVAARRAHRRNRTDGAILANTDNPPAGLVHGIRQRRVGED